MVCLKNVVLTVVGVRINVGGAVRAKKRRETTLKEEVFAL